MKNSWGKCGSVDTFIFMPNRFLAQFAKIYYVLTGCHTYAPV